MKPQFLIIGKIKRVHGIKGEVQLQVLTDYPEKIRAGLVVFIAGTEGERRLIVEKARSTNNALILKFEEVNHRDEAEALKGATIEIPFEAAEKLPPGSYWYHDVIGILVYDTSGAFLGRVTDILRTGSNDVYLVKSEAGREFYIPAIKEVVKEIDVEKHKMVIAPMPGLLE